MTSKKLTENLDRGLWAYYGHPDADYEAAAAAVDTDTGTVYMLTMHHGCMPAFSTQEFATIDELEAAMRELEPDLRKWRLTELDG